MLKNGNTCGILSGTCPLFSQMAWINLIVDWDICLGYFSYDHFKKTQARLGQVRILRLVWVTFDCNGSKWSKWSKWSKCSKCSKCSKFKESNEETKSRTSFGLPLCLGWKMLTNNLDDDGRTVVKVGWPVTWGLLEIVKLEHLLEKRPGFTGAWDEKRWWLGTCQKWVTKNPLHHSWMPKPSWIFVWYNEWST